MSADADTPCFDIPSDLSGKSNSSNSNSSNNRNSPDVLPTKSNKSDQTIPLMSNIVSQSHIVPKADVENRSKATRMQMEQEWRDSLLFINDGSVPAFMKQTGIYKNVYEQYNWYLDQVFEKHSDYFIACMERLNQAKQNMYCEFTTLADVVYFQNEYQHKIIGGEYMSFSENEVKRQFGLPLKSLLIFLEGSECYSRRHRIKYTAGSSKCLIAQLKTRMLSNDNVQHLTLINLQLPSVLCEAVDVISTLFTTSDTLKGSTSNTTKWQKSEEYRLQTAMVEKSEQINLLKCIDVYFQWYMNLVSEKHADKFTQRIAEINIESSKLPDGYTITVIDNHLALGLLGFQLHYKDALENGEVCMGFAKHEVDEQYGITVESLFTFNKCARKYSESGITVCQFGTNFIVSDLITRMKNSEYRTYLGDFNQNMVQILYKTFEMVSNLTEPSKFDVKLHLQRLRDAEEDKDEIDQQQEKNTNHHFSNRIAIQERINKSEEEWQKSEEYRLHTEMVEKSEQINLLQCIDEYFQWYMNLVSEKHADMFTQRIADINKESSKVPDGYTITVVDKNVTLCDNNVALCDNNVALGLLGFQVHYKDALENGEVCMGFAKHEVDEQYGITVESLFTFNKCAKQYSESGITVYEPEADCIVSDLITRMKNAEYRTYLGDFNQNMVQILYKTFEMVSNLTAPNSKLYVKLQEALEIFSGKASSQKMKQEWEDSALFMNDRSVVAFMRETGIYKNVYEQYNWYLDQVFEKHSDYFIACMERLNQAKQNPYGEFTTLVDVVYFQNEYRHKIIDGEYMGFSEHEVKRQFGLPLKSLLIFMRGFEYYDRHSITYAVGSSKCLIAQLKTRMLSNDNVQHLTLINCQLPSVLSEAVEVISTLTTTSEGSISNTTEWQKSEEYRLHTEMVEKSKQVNLLQCIDEYFQWYMNLVSEKHADMFTQRIADINKESSKVPDGYTISVVDKNVTLCDNNVALCDNNVALGLLGFQVHYKDALENGEVCMGFSKSEVDEQYGITVESLFTFNECARKYSESGIKTFARSRCIVSELITRMKNAEYRTYLGDFNQNMVQILYKTLEIVSELTLLPSKFDVKLHLQMLRDVEEDKDEIDQQQEKNTNHHFSNIIAIQERINKSEEEWQKSEEYRLHAEMVEKSEQINLLKCIDVYFQWYMKLISEKHADKFTQRIADINKESSKVPDGYTITVVDNHLALGLLGFQLHYKDALENGEVCMGFSKHEVDEQYGITVESLFTFSECAKQYSKSGITVCYFGTNCIVSALITRMKNAEYRTYLGDFNQNMVQILYKTFEMVSNLTAPNSKLYVKLQEALEIFSGKASSQKMKQEWEDSALFMNDRSVVAFMRETGIYKNVYEQYNWYLDQVFEKHSDYFIACMERLNQAKQNPYGEFTTLADVVYFQNEYRHKIIDGEYMGFSEHEVKRQFGLPLKSLLIFLEGSEWYDRNSITYTAGSSKCLIAQLKTRMLSNDNVQHLTLIDCQLPSVLSEAVEVISKLAP